MRVYGLKTLMTSGSEVALLGDMSFFSGQKKNDEAKTVGSFTNMPKLIFVVMFL